MLKQIKWSSILMSVGYIIAGVLLVVYPEVSANIICYVAGIAACVFGVVSLTTYFLLDLKDSLFRNEFAIGVMAIIAGILMIVKRDLLFELVPIIMGLVIVTSGFIKLQRAVVAHRIHYDKAMVYTGLAVISIILGLIIMFFMSGRTAQNVLFITIGAGLIYCGTSDLIITLFLANKFHQFLEMFEKEPESQPQVYIPEPEVPADDSDSLMGE